MEDTINTLLRKCRNEILNKQCLLKFDEALNHGLNSLTSTEKFKGISYERKLLVLENAIRLLAESCEEGNHSHSFHFNMTKHLFKALRNLVAGPTNDSPSSSKNGKSQKLPTNLKEEQPKAKSPPRVSRVKATKPNEDAKTHMYDEINVHIRTGRTQALNQHVRCTRDNCKFCFDMFSTLHLTSCKAVHPKKKPCIPDGWYPHIGVGLWNRLKKYHDSNKVFKLKPIAIRDFELPSVRNSTLENKNEIEETASTITLRSVTSKRSLTDPEMEFTDEEHSNISWFEQMNDHHSAKRERLEQNRSYTPLPRTKINSDDESVSSLTGDKLKSSKQ